MKEFEDFLLLPSRERHLLDNLRSMHKKRQRESSRPRLNSGKTRNNRRKNLGGLGSKATTASESSTGNYSLKQVRFADELEIDLEPLSTLKSNEIIAEVGIEDKPSSDTVSDVSNEVDPNNRSEDRQTMISITGYRYKDGKLQLRLLMDSEETHWIDFRDVKEDYPRRCATYIVDNCKSRSGKRGRDRVLSWAKKTLRDCERAVKRMVRLYDFVLDDDENIRRVRRALRAKKKNKRKAPPKRFKYGVQVPKDVNDAYRLDKDYGNNF